MSRCLFCIGCRVCRWWYRGAANKFEDVLGDGGALLFLKEVAGVFDDDAWLFAGGGNELAEEGGGATGDGVTIGEHDEGGAVPTLEEVAGGGHLGGAVVFGGGGDEAGPDGGTRFVAGIGEGGFVAGDDFRGEGVAGGEGAFDDAADGEVGDALAEALPFVESFAEVFVAGGEEGVHDDEAAEAVGVLANGR